MSQRMIPEAEESGKTPAGHNKRAFPDVCSRLLRVGCKGTQLLHAAKTLSTGSWWREAEMEARSLKL